MSFDPKTAIKTLDTIVHGLDAIQTFTGLGGMHAAEALAGIESVLSALKDGFDGKLTPDAVKAAIDGLHDQIKANNDAADKRLHDKFDPAV